MAVEESNYDQRALEAMATSDEYVLVAIARDEEGNRRAGVYSSCMTFVPFAVEALKRYFATDYEED